MRSPGVIPINPAGDFFFCSWEVWKVFLPDAFFFQRAKEPFDEAVLFRCVGGDVLLREVVVSAGGAESFALKHKAVVASQGRRWGRGRERFEALQVGIFEGDFRLASTPAEGKLKADDFAVVAINDDGQVPPTVSPAGNMRQIRCPAEVALRRLAYKRFRPGARRPRAFVAKPALDFEDSIDGFAVDCEARLAAQQGPKAAISERGVGVDEQAKRARQGFVHLLHPRGRRRRRPLG